MNETEALDASGTETEVETTEVKETEGSETNGNEEKSKVESESESKEDQEEYEVVKSANREWKLPKEAAKQLKLLQKNYTQANQERAQYRRTLDQLENDPDSVFESVLSKKGTDLDSWAEKRLMQKLEQLNKTPEQIELENYKKELAQYKQKEEMTLKQQKEAEDRQISEYVEKQLGEEIGKAWKESGLPADIVYIKQISALIYDSVKLAQSGKIERVLTAKEAADIVKTKTRATWKKTLPTLDDSELLELIGTEKFNALKKAEISRLTDPASKAGLGQKTGNSPKESTQGVTNIKRPLTEKEYRALYE